MVMAVCGMCWRRVPAGPGRRRRPDRQAVTCLAWSDQGGARPGQHDQTRTGDECARGLGGHDTINGYGANDRICGGSVTTRSRRTGNDQVQGNAGDDTSRRPGSRRPQGGARRRPNQRQRRERQAVRGGRERQPQRNLGTDTVTGGWHRHLTGRPSTPAELPQHSASRREPFTCRSPPPGRDAASSASLARGYR